MNYSRKNIKAQVLNEYETLKAKGYDTDDWDAEAAVDQAIQYFEETGNSEAEIRYDGLKFFTVEAQ